MKRVKLWNWLYRSSPYMVFSATPRR